MRNKLRDFKNLWLGRAHLDNPWSSPYLRVLNLNHICKVPFCLVRWQSQALRVRTWTSLEASTLSCTTQMGGSKLGGHLSRVTNRHYVWSSLGKGQYRTEVGENRRQRKDWFRDQRSNRWSLKLSGSSWVSMGIECQKDKIKKKQLWIIFWICWAWCASELFRQKNSTDSWKHAAESWETGRGIEILWEMHRPRCHGTTHTPIDYVIR